MFTVANPWGWLALTAIPVVVAIYFYRQQVHHRDVSALFLWPPSEELPPAGRKWSRLESPLSLFLEVLAILLLSSLLAGVRWEQRMIAPHCVVVLDHSASMAAKNTAGVSSRDRAIQVIESLCSEMGPLPSVRLTVILSGPRPTALVGPAAPADRGLGKLSSWEPILPRHSYLPALELAGRVSEEGGELLLITDRPAEAAAETGGGVRVRGVGEALPNIAISVAERKRVRDGTLVTVRLSALSDTAETRTLRLLGTGETVLGEQSVTLEAGGDARVQWPVPEGHPVVEVRIDQEDALALDNRVRLVEPKATTVRIRCDFHPRSDSRKKIERACLAAGDTELLAVDSREIPELWITPADQQPPERHAWWIAIGTPPSLSGGTDLPPMLGPYFPDSSHPLMQNLDWRGIVWGGAQQIKRDSSVLPLLTAGEESLVYQWLQSPVPAYVVNADLPATNVHKSPAWVLFFHNLIRLRREAMPGLRRWNYRPGEAVSYQKGLQESEEVEFRGPDGSEVALIRLRRRVETPETWRPGVYEVRRAGSSEILDRFSVNLLDREESDLRKAADSTILPTRGIGARDLSVTTTWRWLPPLLSFLLLSTVLFGLYWAARRGIGGALR